MGKGAAASRRQPARRWLRRLVRAGAASALTCVAVYATLPWWLPRSWLADRLAAELTRITGRPASVDGLTLGWRQGVVVEGISIARKPAYGDGEMLRIGRASCGLTPLRTLWTGRIDRLVIAQADCWAVIGPDGRLNVTDLGRQSATGLATHDWRLHNFRLHVVSDLPDQPEIAVQIGSLACQLDPATGRADYEIDATLAHTGVPAGGEIRWHGELLVPRLNPAVTLSGGTRFEWRHLDLSSLPVSWWPALGLEHLAGRSGGKLTTRTDDARGLIFELDVHLEGVEATRRGAPGPDRVGDATLALAGSYNAALQELVLDRLRYEIPDRLLLDGPTQSDAALIYTPRDRTSLRLDLAGETPDLAGLLQMTAASQTLAEHGLQLSGPCELSLAVTRSVEQTRCRLTFDATGVATGTGDAVRHTSGAPATLELSAAYRERGAQLDIEHASLQLGGTHVEVSGLVPTRGLVGGGVDLIGWLLALTEEGSFAVALSAERTEEIGEAFPILRRRFPEIAVAGPVRLRITQQRAGDERHLDWRLAMPVASTCRAASFLDKPAHVALEASGRLVYPARPDKAPGRFGLELACGEGRLRVGEASSSWQVASRRLDGERGTARADPATAIDVFANMPIELEGVEELIHYVPGIARRLSRLGGEWQHLSGACKLDITLNASLASARQRWRVAAGVRADELDIELGRSFRKPADAPARVRGGWTYDGFSAKAYNRVDIDAELAGAQADATWEWSAGTERQEINLSLSDAGSVVRHFPAWSRSLARYRLKGGGAATILAVRDDGRYAGDLRVDLTAGAFEVPASPRFVKRAGIPLTAATRFSLRPEDGAPRAWQIGLNDLSVQFGSSELVVPDGKVSVATADRQAALDGQGLAGDALIRSALGGQQLVLTEAALNGTVNLRLDGTLQASIDRLGDWMRRHDVAGSATADLGLRFACGDRLALQWELDATGLHVNAAPDWMKPAGLNSSGAGWATVGLRPPTEGYLLDVGHLSARLGHSTLTGTGSVVVGGGGATDLTGWSFQGTLDLPQLDEWATLRPRLSELTPRGSAVLNVSLSGSEDRVACESLAAAFDHAGIRLDDTELTINGEVFCTEELAAINGLEIRAGRSDATVVGRIDGPESQPRGELAVSSQLIDLDELAELLDRSGDKLPAWIGPGNPFVSGPEGLGGLFRRARLDIAVGLHELWLTEPTSQQRYLIDELSGVAAIADGKLSWPLRCCLNGGLIEGRANLEPAAAEPRFELTYQALGVAPVDAGTGVDVRPYLELTFPGMVPIGPISLIDETRQRPFEPQHPNNYPVGSGELIVEGGVVTGKAAPDYITQILPQLDFARFEFQRMHDWFDKHADGRVDHHMVFRGNIYHIYADGYSTPDRRIHYEVGVDFLAEFDKRSWAKTGQGRLPLFTKDAYVGRDGRLVNERVRYVPLTKLVDSIFLSNTLIETSYLALREQISRMRQ